MDAIAAFDLTKSFDPAQPPALQGINLAVPEGSAAACVGRAGSGKTTLVRLLAGLSRASSGECSVLGLSPVHEGARLHSMMGVALDSARLYDSMSLWDNLRFFAGAHQVSAGQAVERISFLLRRLNLWEQRDKRPDRLSTGDLVRAGLCRALVHRPRVLLVDEEGAGMDRETAGLVQDLLEYVLAEEGISLLFCTQNMNYAQGFCQRFALLDKGVLLARGTLEGLRVGGGVSLRAALRLREGQPGPEGFFQERGLWQRLIQGEDEMPGIIARTVGQGLDLYEAKVIRPGLEEIYAAYLAGGRRREAAPYEQTAQTRTEIPAGQGREPGGVPGPAEG